MRRVCVLDRDICGGSADLVIVPCSGKMKEMEKPRNQARIDHFGLPTPHSLRGQFGYGQVSPVFPPTRNVGKIAYFAFAASVLNTSDPNAIESIGEQIGRVTQENANIRLVEAPFLGCGDGGLSPSVAILAIALGFLRTSHPDAVLQLCSDSAVSVRLAEAALEEAFRIVPQPSLSGDSVRRPGQATNYDYDVALSFANEQRPFADVLSYLLKSHGIRVFYDIDERAELWGKNLVDYLSDLYFNRSQLCVALVSADYLRKEWTNLERQAAQARAFRDKDQVYLLPVRFDSSELPGLPPTVGYLDEKIGVEEVFRLIMRKLGQS